jgi:hypothetical protein
MTLAGFPHSGIRASTPTCGSARLIAAHHALHRLLAPRHPPSALSSLTTNPSGQCFLPLRGRDQGSLDENSPLTTDLLSVSSLPSKVPSALNTMHSLGTRASSSIQLSENLCRVGLVRFELTTPRLSSVCSNQLSYRPEITVRKRSGSQN